MPGVSIVLETENVDGEADEIAPLLADLAERIRADGIGDELLILTDAAEAARQTVAGSGLGSLVTVRILHRGNEGYYGVKNVGAAAATGEIVVFVDSDVRPVPGWLAALVEPFEDPAVQIVGGETAFGPLDSAWSRAIRLAGFFPPPRESGPMWPRDRFFANNYAARQGLLVSHPFDPDTDTHGRGQCWTLGQLLQREGIVLWSQPAARTMHRVPPRSELWRGGFDEGVNMLETDRAAGRSPWRSCLRLGGYCLKRSGRALTSARHGAGVRGRELPHVLGLSVLYNVAVLNGLAAAAVVPRSGPDRNSGRVGRSRG